MLKKTEPLSFTDLKPLTEDVPVGNQTITINGISFDVIFDLMVRFPTFQGALVGRGIDRSDLMKLGPKAISVILAGAIGHPGDEVQELAASKLSMEVQLNLLEAVWRVSFTSGFGPFVQRVRTILGTFVADGKGQDTSSQKPSKRSAEQPTPVSGS